MIEAADTAELDPDRLSFIRTLNIVRRQVTNQAGFPPETLNQARTDAITEILERVTTGRRKRTYPRVHKRGNHHSYSIKKPEHRQRPYNPKPAIRPPNVA